MSLGRMWWPALISCGLVIISVITAVFGICYVIKVLEKAFEIAKERK